MDFWPPLRGPLLLRCGEVEVPVLPIYSSEAMVTTWTPNGMWTVFVHCGPQAPLPRIQRTEMAF